jgi:hypothetical protein
VAPGVARHRHATLTSGDEVMSQYKFQVGQMVTLLSRRVAPAVPRSSAKAALNDSPFQITRLMPVEGAYVQYRIKNALTGQERAVFESELDPA